ncbi:MAG TPA: primosomal protein N' [Bacteroidota bacterium]|nr:primosomal protein N' [Bacteroidota bacterium]
MKQTLADVALPLPIDRAFTYVVPPELASAVQPGCRVKVPIGKKKMTGIVVGLPHTTSVRSLKQIEDVLDSFPAVSPELLQLARWIADYYAAPLGEVLKAFLPQGMSAKQKRIVSLRRLRDGEAHNGAEAPTQAQAKILSALSNSTRLSVAELQKRTKVRGIDSVLSELQGSDLVEIVEDMKALKLKREKFILKKSSPAEVQTRGNLQRKLSARLQQLSPEPYPVRSLLKETRASLSALRKFIEAGCVEIIEQEVDRQVEFSPDPNASQIIPLQLTKFQSSALEQINHAVASAEAKIFLLFGITGSGKTQVYIEAIRKALQQGKTAIVLVPEISLTPQIVRRFRLHFGNEVAVMHSRMSEGERYDAWRHCQDGKYKIVIGPRSAIFAPLAHLGLIVVDEEHEASYKQFDANPRYNARDVAIVRAQQAGAVVVLGSATPSIESFYNAENGKYILLELPERIDDAILPSVRLVNMIDERKRRYAVMKERAKSLGKKAFEGGFHSISSILEEKIRERIRKKEGIILLQNRRGFAPFIECMECGHVERCDQCDVTLTYHLAKKHLRCHYCGSVKAAPSVCAQCKGVNLKLQGFGTQRVEQDVAKIFPEARVLRMDLDTTSRKGAHDRLLQQFGRGEADILLGTQMVAKGLDFPRVTLVGVISADTQMLLPDFRSAERTFQLLTQVAGRAGRSTLRGEVIIQSYQTDHYSLKHVLEHDYRGFYDEELRYRKSALYTPFARLVLVEFKGPAEGDVQRAAEDFAGRVRKLSEKIILLGPAAAVISKIKNNYRWQIIVKAAKTNDPNAASMRNAVARVARECSLPSPRRGVVITVDVDPQGIM